MQPDPEVTRHGEHVPLAGVLAGLAQLAAAAIDLIAGEPAERRARADRHGDHLGAQLGLRLELYVAGDLRPLPAPAVLAPGFRQVKPEVIKRVPAGGDIRAVHHGLAVLHLPGDPGVLAGHPDRHLPFLQLSGLIQHQHRARIGQVGQDEPLQRRQRRLPVPGVLGQQRLHPPRRGMPGGLSELPARPAVPALSQQRDEISERGETRPGLREYRREQGTQLVVQPAQPAAILYDDRSGHLLILSCHRARSSRWPSRAHVQPATQIMIIQTPGHKPGL